MAIAMLTYSCATMQVSAPKEGGIVFTRITPEDQNVYSNPSAATPFLAVSSDGKKIAFLIGNSVKSDIYTLNVSNPNISNQRTYRGNVSSGFSFSPNGEKIAFRSGSMLYETSSTEGSICTQVAEGACPAYSYDGKYIYFQRLEGYNGLTLWRYEIANHTLSTLCKGAGASASTTDENIIYFVRNQTSSNELVRFNCKNGVEATLLTKKNFVMSCVSESPDGKWLLFQAVVNTKPQIFVLRTDGTGFTQLTFHQSGSGSPVWSADGKEIYFISSRGGSVQKKSIWKMTFPLSD